MSYPWSIISSGDFVPGKLEKMAPGEHKVSEVFRHKTCNLCLRVSVWLQIGFIWFSNLTLSGESSKSVRNTNFLTLMNDCWSLENLRHLLHSWKYLANLLRDQPWGVLHTGMLQWLPQKRCFLCSQMMTDCFFSWVTEDSFSRLRS